MTRTVECFYPGANFPAVSVTGTRCSLSCKHCSGRYLQSMIPATTPEDLLSVAEALAERGAAGFLLSGGSDEHGKVPVSGFEDAIREIKATTDLKINAHVGLASHDEIEALVGCGIDAFSTDVYGCDDTIREVLGLDARAEDYQEVVRSLRDCGAPRLAPHVCIGIHGGSLRGESRALELLRPFHPEVLILISLIPTRGTPYSGATPPDKESVKGIIVTARESFPDTKLMLGCMRSKMERSYEAELVSAGLDGIVLPSSQTVTDLRNAGHRIRKRATCCALI